MTASPGDIKLFLHQLDDALAVGTPSVRIDMSADIAQLFKDFLHDFDPDMPPRPMSKILGPLVGDYMMNAKLKRLDELADRLGPLVLLLGGMVNQLERL